MTGLIDLHLHTTASDGQSRPDELVDQAWAAGIRTMSVTDHDTRGGLGLAAERANEIGMEFISGIEITSVHMGKDVHVLAYNLPADALLIDQLVDAQRLARVSRAREIADRLAGLGAPIDMEALLTSAANSAGKAIARPQIAQLLIAAGHVMSVSEAFERYLSEGAPAYVPHDGAAPQEVVARVARCGGVSCLAHPGQFQRDDLIPSLVDAGLDGLEAYHSSHDAVVQVHYREMALAFGLVVSGGSDFHGIGTRRSEFFGVTNLPRVDYLRFRERLSERTSDSLERD